MPRARLALLDAWSNAGATEANRPNISDPTNKMTGVHDMMRADESGTSLMKTSNDAQGSRSSRRASEQCEVRENSLDTTTVYPRMMTGPTREYECGHPGSLESFRPEIYQHLESESTRRLKNRIILFS
jgi:hypothetical protein